MSKAIRIESDSTVDLARATAWLSRHRGQSVELDEARQIELGVPVAGAGAVLVAVTVQDGDSAAPQLGGVVRAIGNRGVGQVMRLVFEGRSPAHLEQDAARSVAVELLGAISRLVDDEIEDEVA